MMILSLNGTRLMCPQLKVIRMRHRSRLSCIPADIVGLSMVGVGGVRLIILCVEHRKIAGRKETVKTNDCILMDEANKSRKRTKNKKTTKICDKLFDFH